MQQVLFIEVLAQATAAAILLVYSAGHHGLWQDKLCQSRHWLASELCSNLQQSELKVKTAPSGSLRNRSRKLKLACCEYSLYYRHSSPCSWSSQAGTPCSLCLRSIRLIHTGSTVHIKSEADACEQLLRGSSREMEALLCNRSPKSQSSQSQLTQASLLHEQN